MAQSLRPKAVAHGARPSNAKSVLSLTRIRIDRAVTVQNKTSEQIRIRSHHAQTEVPVTLVKKLNNNSPTELGTSMKIGIHITY